MATDTAKAVTDFIVENFLFGVQDDAPAPEASFLELGYIDSTGMLELVTFLEETFEIEVGDDELIPDNLDSVEKITAYVARKKG